MSRLGVIFLACVALLALAACGEDRGSVSVEGGSSTTSTGGTGTTSTGTTTTGTTPTTTTPEETAAPAGEVDETVTIKADAGGALAFDKSEVSVKAGTVKFIFENPSTLPHALEVEGDGLEEKTPTIRQNGTADLTVALTAGEYEFYCPVGGHKEAGMQGTLTVE
jgi:plastocyanin